MLAGCAVFVFLGMFFADDITAYVARKREISLQESVRIPLPETVPSSEASMSMAAILSSDTSVLSASFQASVRAAVNWDVPFTSQAPHGNWDEPFKEACEEASVLMVLRYFQDRDIASVEEADLDIRHLAARNAELGFPVDDTVEEMAVLLHDQDPSLRTELLRDPTEEVLKQVLSEGALVIVPAQGQFLKNPYFTAPGPRYHMLVLRGYTEDGFVITNDPGTKRGEEYVYSWERLLFAIHDWNDGDVENGAKVALVVRR